MFSPSKVGMIQNQPVSAMNPWNLHTANWNTPKNVVNRRNRNNSRFPPAPVAPYYPPANGVMGWAPPWIGTPPQPQIIPTPPIVPVSFP